MFSSKFSGTSKVPRDPFPERPSYSAVRKVTDQSLLIFLTHYTYLWYGWLALSCVALGRCVRRYVIISTETFAIYFPGVMYCTPGNAGMHLMLAELTD